MVSRKKFIISAEEWCILPEFEVPAIKARIDTGATTSSLHAVNIKAFNEDGQAFVSFDVYPLDNKNTCIHCIAPQKDKRLVKSSFGDTQMRYVIGTTVKVGKRAWEIELTLSNRSAMGYKMLLGREAINPDVLIDANSKLLHGDKTEKTITRLFKKYTTKKTGLHIAVLATNPSLYSNRRIIEAGEKAGHKMTFLNIQQCFIKLDNNFPQIHYRGGKVINNIDAVIPRIRPSQTFYGCSLVRHFQSMNIYCLNNSDAIRNSRDKLYSLQCLQEMNINIPETGFANSPVETDELIDMVGGTPLIVKLLESSQGKGVFLAETKKAAQSVINGFKILKANLLVQEFIKESSGQDIRCFVLGGRVISAYKRIAAPDEFRANIHLGGVAEKVTITSKIKSIATKACKSLNLDVAGVDIINSSRGPLVLEVNSSPGLEGIEKTTEVNISEKIISYIERNKRQ